MHADGQQKDETSVKKNEKKKSKGVNVDGELMAKDKPLEVVADRNETTDPATEKNKKHQLEEQKQEEVLLELNDDDAAEQNRTSRKLKEL